MIRLIAMDLDNTLLTTDKQITANTIKTLAACRQNGIHVVIASGRVTESILVFINRIGLGLEKNYHLGDGGGSIFNEDGIIHQMGAFDPVAYEGILSQVREQGLSCIAINSENMYYESETNPLVSVYRKTEKYARRPYIFPIDDLAKVTNPLKFVFWHTGPEEKAKIESLFFPGTINFSSGGAMHEITMAELNKGNGLKELASLYGVKMNEVAAFGDSENDIAMLREAGIGFAVSNAMDNVKAAADIIGEKSNDEDGVAWLIEKYILKRI